MSLKKTYVGFLGCQTSGTSDRWNFNFMNCLSSWTPDKLHGSLHPPLKTKDPFVALGTPSVTLKISPKWRISSEQQI